MWSKLGQCPLWCLESQPSPSDSQHDCLFAVYDGPVGKGGTAYRRRGNFCNFKRIIIRCSKGHEMLLNPIHCFWRTLQRVFIIFKKSHFTSVSFLPLVYLLLSISSEALQDAAPRCHQQPLTTIVFQFRKIIRVHMLWPECPCLSEASQASEDSCLHMVWVSLRNSLFPSSSVLNWHTVRRFLPPRALLWHLDLYLKLSQPYVSGHEQPEEYLLYQCHIPVEVVSFGLVLDCHHNSTTCSF